MSDPPHGFKEGQPVWVEDGDGRRHPGVFVGDNEAAGWFGTLEQTRLARSILCDHLLCAAAVAAVIVVQLSFAP